MRIVFRRFYLPNRPLVKVVIAFLPEEGEYSLRWVGFAIGRPMLQQLCEDFGAEGVRRFWQRQYARLRAELEGGGGHQLRDWREAIEITDLLLPATPEAWSALLGTAAP